MDGGEKNDVAYHLSTASRALDRAAGDIGREIVDKMAEYAKSVLSKDSVLNLTKLLKDKKKPKSMLSEQDLENSLGGLFEYLNENVCVTYDLADISSPCFRSH